MNLESAVERLYTDESLAADVDDKTAGPLLKWAEAILPSLLARGEAEFEDAFVTLKKLIKSIARLIDLRGELDMDERAERAEKIQEFARQLGISVKTDNLDALTNFDGPELVAQMVGGTNTAGETATAASSPDGSRPMSNFVTEAGLPVDPQRANTPPQADRPAENASAGTSNATGEALRSSIGDFFSRIAESLDADTGDPDSKE